MVAKTLYIPARGDLIWVTFDPTLGHEQRGRRPALVLTPESYNGTTGLAFVCPVTSKIKGYPFEVEITLPGMHSCILVDQIRSIDWRSRKAEKIDSLSKATLLEVLNLLKTILGL